MFTSFVSALRRSMRRRWLKRCETFLVRYTAASNGQALHAHVANYLINAEHRVIDVVPILADRTAEVESAQIRIAGFEARFDVKPENFRAGAVSHQRPGGISPSSKVVTDMICRYIKKSSGQMISYSPFSLSQS
ncbi:MAG: hypothetical protein KKC24_01165 [Gammaproteobacteria bacterium]|nr:hypothetical protein [Gammaproteobacteria bacterium]MBU0817446.1 hypothetical protein [Gammaproteobacteria bacterium]MBU0845142.1 hypothetical protein [Gammaproteobacteria bacterium]MBU1839879.1 hypothetical protein [Gammaproteobacteria bacterium]